MFVNTASSGGGPSPGGNSSNTQQTITTLSAHGFSAGDVVRQDGAGWSKSLADSSTNAEVYGVVQSTPSAVSFVLVTNGLITISGGFSAGQTYFLSNSLAGVYTTSSPTAPGSISKPVLLGIDSNTALVVPQMRGEEITGSVANIAQVYWVATNGNDTTGNGTILAPFLTVQKAHDQALTDWSPSDYVQINIAPGTYAGATTVTRPRTIFTGTPGVSRTQSVTFTGLFSVVPDSATSLTLDTITCQGIYFVPGAVHYAVEVSGTGLFSFLMQDCDMQTTQSSSATTPVYIGVSHVGRPRVQLNSCLIRVDSVSTGPACVDLAGTADLYITDTEIYAASGGSSAVRFVGGGYLVVLSSILESSFAGPTVYVSGAQPSTSPKVTVVYSTVRNSNAVSSSANTLENNTSGVTAMLVHNILTALSGAANVVHGNSSMTLSQGYNVFTTSNNTYNVAQVTKVDLVTTFTGV